MILKKKKIYISLALERFGTTVKEQIDNSEFSKDVSGIDLIFEILDALEFMHNIEYIFGDIKPSDIIKHNKTPILIAFDKVKWHLGNNGNHLLSVEESSVGTQAYSINREIFLK